jgi:hypothetical protein
METPKEVRMDADDATLEFPGLIGRCGRGTEIGPATALELGRRGPGGRPTGAP